MFTANSNDVRPSRYAATSNNSKTFADSYFTRLPLRSYSRSKLPDTSLHSLQVNPASFARMKRLKNKKVNGIEKMEFNRRRTAEYTEMAYREAVSKLKYLLAESYGPKTIAGISECGEDADDHSIISDNSRIKDGNVRPFARSYFSPAKKIHASKALNNLALSTADLQSIPPELTSFIQRQEEYIQQLERESQYCRDELTNLLRKVREVVAENEALHNKSKAGFLKSALDEHSSVNGEVCNSKKLESPETESFEKKWNPRVLDGPIIVFESRISELEAQLTQSKLELRKAQEENEQNLKRLSENCANVGSPETKAQLDHAIRAKYEAELKLEDAQKTFSSARDRENEALQRAKRATESLQQVEFEKSQYEAEIRRLKGDLERQLEKQRDAAQEANRRIADERQQAERRYSQQVEQLSADVQSHWDVANKTQLESEKQRRELTEFRRELSQKQSFIDNLKKELQNKISTLQSELNQTIVEKDATEQEVLGIKLAAERNERQARQEQSRLQSEINSYKQRLERTDADLVHCRRENLRLLEQIASLEKEISMTKVANNEGNQGERDSVKSKNPKELTSMIMDLESKHAATVAGLEDVLTNQATIVSQLTAECQSLTQRMEANTRKHKEEIASLQSNIEYLTHIIEKSTESPKEDTLATKVESVPNENYAATEFTSNAKEPENLSEMVEEYLPGGLPEQRENIERDENNEKSTSDDPMTQELPQPEELYEPEHTDAPAPEETGNVDTYICEDNLQYNQSQYEQYQAFDSENAISQDHNVQEESAHFESQLQNNSDEVNSCGESAH